MGALAVGDLDSDDHDLQLQVLALAKAWRFESSSGTIFSGAIGTHRLAPRRPQG
jgi:hypothetical protein